MSSRFAPHCFSESHQKQKIHGMETEMEMEMGSWVLDDGVARMTWC